MTDAPLHIRRFETLQLASIVVGLIHQFAVIDGGIFDAIMGAAIMIALTLFVSRRRKNLAKWLLLGMFVFGAAFMAWNAPTVFALGYPAITLAVTLMQAIALAFLFTPQSADWLRRSSSPA